MALSLDFKVCRDTDCKGFTFTELTDLYDASTNTGGWGSPNVELADIDTVYLTVDNLTTDVTYDDLDITTEVEGGSGDAVKLFDSEDLEVSGVSIGDVRLPNGVYCFTMTVTMDDASTYTKKQKYVWLCGIECTLAQMAASFVEETCTDCSEVYRDKWLEYTGMYESIIFAACIASSSKINSFIEALEALLANQDCYGC